MHWFRWRHGIPMNLPTYYNRVAAKGWVHKGYRWLSTEEGEVMEHRHLMQIHLGRTLHVDEIVHHRNGNKLDNRLDNLEVMARDVHTSHHRPRRKPCIVCGKDDPHQSRGLCAKHRQQARRAERA